MDHGLVLRAYATSYFPLSPGRCRLCDARCCGVRCSSALGRSHVSSFTMMVHPAGLSFGKGAHDPFIYHAKRERERRLHQVSSRFRATQSLLELPTAFPASSQSLHTACFWNDISFVIGAVVPRYCELARSTPCSRLPRLALDSDLALRCSLPSSSADWNALTERRAVEAVVRSNRLQTSVTITVSNTSIMVTARILDSRSTVSCRARHSR
jgi:hypothetical protein